MFAAALSVAFWNYIHSGPLPVTVSGSPPGEFDWKIDLNSAGIARLQLLPGIGPVTARRIVDYRMENGPFADISELRLVQGIGPAKLQRISPYLKLSNEQ